MLPFCDLCARLGRIARMHVDLGRPKKKEPGRIVVRWPCGCRGTGETLRRVSYDACPGHAHALEPASARA